MSTVIAAAMRKTTLKKRANRSTARRPWET